MLVRESVNTKYIAHGFIKSKILCYNIFDKTLSLFLSLSLCETLSNQLYLTISHLLHVFQDSCISGSTFFRLQVFQGPGFFRVRVQVLEVANLHNLLRIDKSIASQKSRVQLELPTQKMYMGFKMDLITIRGVMGYVGYSNCLYCDSLTLIQKVSEIFTKKTECSVTKLFLLYHNLR